MIGTSSIATRACGRGGAFRRGGRGGTGRRAQSRVQRSLSRSYGVDLDAVEDLPADKATEVDLKNLTNKVIAIDGINARLDAALYTVETNSNRLTTLETGGSLRWSDVRAP